MKIKYTFAVVLFGTLLGITKETKPDVTFKFQKNKREKIEHVSVEICQSKRYSTCTSITPSLVPDKSFITYIVPFQNKKGRILITYSLITNRGDFRFFKEYQWKKNISNNNTYTITPENSVLEGSYRTAKPKK